VTIADVLEGRARWCVVTGDCLELIKAIPDRSVAHVITDPPYSEHTHSKSRAGARKVPLKDGNGVVSRCAIDREVDFGFASITQDQREACSDHFVRVAKRWTLAFCDVESSQLWAGSMTSAGLDYCRTGAWIKQGATPQFTGDRPAVGFEAIVICHQPGRKRWNGGGSHAVWTHLTVIERGGQAISNNSRVHPTQKPLSLMLELVDLFTDPDDIVLDPFAGSGTTGVACLRLGRRFIGFELKEEHAETGRERLRAEGQGSTLQAARAGQGVLFGGGR